MGTGLLDTSCQIPRAIYAADGSRTVDARPENPNDQLRGAHNSNILGIAAGLIGTNLSRYWPIRRVQHLPVSTHNDKSPTSITLPRQLFGRTVAEHQVTLADDYKAVCWLVDPKRWAV